jgi:hypothetical protein
MIFIFGVDIGSGNNESLQYFQQQSSMINNNNNIGGGSKGGTTKKKKKIIKSEQHQLSNFKNDFIIGSKVRTFSCKFCENQFSSPHALVGHQNTYKKERAREKHLPKIKKSLRSL